MEFTEDDTVAIEEQKVQLDGLLEDFIPVQEVVEETGNEQKGEEVEEVGAEKAAEETSPVEDIEGKTEPAETVETKTEVTPPPVSEFDEIRNQNKILLERIEELSGRIIKPVEEQKVEKEVIAEIVDFIGEDDIDDVMSSKELFNGVIAKVIQLTEERLMQKVLVSIPTIVAKQTQQQAAITDATNKFYLENPDLEPVKKTVAAVANEIYSTNPQLSIAEIFTKSAEKTREILGLRNKALGAINEKGRTPEFVKTSGGGRDRVKEPSLDKFQQELNDLLNF